MTGARQPQRQREARARQRDAYTHFVNTMKFALPSLAFLIVVAVLFWPNLVSTGKQAVDIARDSLTPGGLRNFSMEGPVFVATDDRNRPYRLTATEASQVNHTATVISLKEPQAEIELSGDGHIRISALSGRYNRKKNQLALAGDVNFSDDRKFSVRTAEATIDLEKKAVWSKSPVVAEGDRGTVAAQGFEVVDRGMTVIFTGRTKVVLSADGEAPRALPRQSNGMSAGISGSGQ